MAVTYTWTINEMFSYPTADGYSDVVFGVNYTLSGAEGDYTADIQGSVPLPMPEGSFTPYADLTQAQVVGWVQDALGPDQVASMDSQIAQMISEQENPTVVVNPLPWS